MPAAHLEVLVEEPSAEAALLMLLPKMLGPSVTFQIHTFQGKTDLLNKLRVRLRGYSSWIPADWRIAVLLDRDDDDCTELKDVLEEHCAVTNLPTKTTPGHGGLFTVLNRVACEELEAWFFGDHLALMQAYPGVPESLPSKAAYRDCDNIRGGTWEQLERVLQRAGHHQGGLAKIQAAREIAAHMDIARNRSPSFVAFRDGVRALIAQ